LVFAVYFKDPRRRPRVEYIASTVVKEICFDVFVFGVIAFNLSVLKSCYTPNNPSALHMTMYIRMECMMLG